MVKIAITPMISSLSILNYVDVNSDQEVLGYGISLIFINSVVLEVSESELYFGLNQLYELILGIE